MKILKFNELLLSKDTIEDSIVEMARINDVTKFPYDVFVNGGDSYGTGRNEHGEPHFHFYDKIKTGNYAFSVLIPTVDEWSQNKDLYISESSNGNYNWEGLIKEKRELINWLDIPNRYDPTKTNIQFIRLQWNVLNSDNRNVKQIKNIQ